MSDVNRYSCQSIDDTDIDAVTEVLRSDFLTQGPAVEAFENSVSRYVQSPFACAVNSATSGLHIALLALDIGPSDMVWTSPNTFVATVNSVLYCGADVALIDIDPDTLNIDPNLLERQLKLADQNGNLPKAIIVVHFGGVPAEMKSINDLATKYNIAIIEDASHALGASIDNEPVGSCKWSDAAVFSFHPVKPITCGEGGMVTCKSPSLHDRLIKLRTHGIQRNPDTENNDLAYEQQSLGFNYRLSDIHAALGKSQLRRSEEFILQRSEMRAIYESQLDRSAVKLQTIPRASRSSHHLLVAQFADQALRDRIKAHLSQKAIGINFHYIPIYKHQFHRNLGTDEDFPMMANYFRTGITLPLHTKLTTDEVEFVCHAINEAIK